MSVTTTPSKLGDLEFFCTIDRKATYSYTVPQYPIESGGDTSYVNVIKNPVKVDLTVFESNSPVTYSSKLTSDEDRENRVKNVKDTLEQMYLANELYTLTTPTETYENMAITSLSFPEDDYANAMEISISLKQVNVTEDQTINIYYHYANVSNADTGTTETTEETITEDSSSSSSSSWLSTAWNDFKKWWKKTFSGNSFDISIGL